MPESNTTRMIVIADGDVIRNNVKNSAQGLQMMPLGFDRYSGQTFGNKDFILNCVNYLSDESGIIQLRNREVKLRLLDKNQIQEEKLKWQFINIIAPLILITLMGIAIGYLRRRRYTK
jgi:ABC-2 type transport system permease protein